jgi:hypothetical protein
MTNRYVPTLLCALLALFAAPARAQDSGLGSQEGIEEPTPPVSSESTPVPSTETNCTDRLDDDHDGLADCADADCFDARACQAGGTDENTEAACRDWLDNDGDGAVDCDDQDCQVPQIRACRGSWGGSSGGGVSQVSGPQSELSAPTPDDLPELGSGQTLEDLMGTNGDIDGERSDETCADGIDNDLDGRTDCQDYGCRFSPNVTVCQPSNGIHLSIVAGGGARLTLNYNADGSYQGNVPLGGITLVQVRALGQIPGIQNSFFLLSARLEDSFRLNFVLFQIPVSTRGHYLQFNSGSGTLSSALIISAARQIMLDRAVYLNQAFEQGNGIVVETGGPIDDEGHFRFRLFGGAGGTQFSSSVGGRFFSPDDRNFSWVAGGQLQIDLAGHYDRIGDDPYMYTPSPLNVSFLAGLKYDTLPNERALAWHALGIFRYWHFQLRAESYSRYVFDYNAAQTAWNVMGTVLIVPRVLLFAADVGGFYHVAPYQNLPTGSLTPTGVTYQPEQFQYRAALHWFFYRDIGIMTLLYAETQREHVAGSLNPDIERVIRIESRFRF